MINNTFVCEDDNIEQLREVHPDGLHFAVGDVHGERRTLEALMEKIRFDPDKDHVYFVGDYNSGGDVRALLDYMSIYYQADYDIPGFHMIRGNHEIELFPVYALENLPDIIVVRGETLNFFIVHAGMISEVFALLNDDMWNNPDAKVYAYRFADECVKWDGPFRNVVYSRHGLYSCDPAKRVWPSAEELWGYQACIIHGHTPYCYFVKHDYYSYGRENLFWQKQHIFFSRSLQSLDIDSNVKGKMKNGESYRGLACVCLEVFDEIASQCGGYLSRTGIRKGPNGVFSVEHIPCWSYEKVGDISRILQAAPKMKEIRLGEDGKGVIV